MQTQEDRAAAVAQANASALQEGLEPDADDIALQAEYIAGNVSVDDLLSAAFKYASEHAGEPS